MRSILSTALKVKGEQVMKIKVAKYISGFLVKNSIRDCFMVTGGGAMHLDDAIGHEDGIHCTFNHHEQACAIAAEGYARMTGRLAAVCVTSGPGGTNAITGVMGGWLDSVPMFVISGQVKRETTLWAVPDLNLRQLGDQEFNIIDSVKNMTRYAVMVTDPKMIAYHLEKALYLALDGRCGPVWLDIPLDVQGARVDTDDLIHFDKDTEYTWDKPHITDAQVEILTRKIKEARAVLIMKTAMAARISLRPERKTLPVSVSYRSVRSSPAAVTPAPARTIIRISMTDRHLNTYLYRSQILIDPLSNG